MCLHKLHPTSEERALCTNLFKKLRWLKRHDAKTMICKLNLLDILIEYGHELKRVATTHGGEYAGPCPWCGGKDRFRVWPLQENGRYWCRRCGKSGDPLSYLIDYRNMGYREACEYLGFQPTYQRKHSIAKKQDIWTSRKTIPPPPIWQDKARVFLDYAIKQLWADPGRKTRRDLSDRGLNATTIRSISLGWNPEDRFPTRVSWGLLDKIEKTIEKPDRTIKKLYIPMGIVIPYVVDGQVIRLRIRRPGGKYFIVSGSDTQSMIIGYVKEYITVVESELDAMLLCQEAGDLVGVIALGNAQSRPDQQVHDLLKHAELILLSLDYDQAGGREAYKWWEKHYAQIKIWFPPAGKDPGEAFKTGIPIREWIQAGLPTHEVNEEINIKPIDSTMREIKPFPAEWIERYDYETLERLAIMAVDGGLSDEEALAAISRDVVMRRSLICRKEGEI